jgi:hypothetical protein
LHWNKNLIEFNKKLFNTLKSFLLIKNCGRAGLLNYPEQGALAQYFKTKKTSSELVVFSYLKHCGESRILLRNILHS